MVIGKARLICDELLKMKNCFVVLPRLFVCLDDFVSRFPVVGVDGECVLVALDGFGIIARGHVQIGECK